MKAIQTLIFDKKKFNRKQALSWAKKHGYKHYTSRIEDKQIRVRQFPTNKIKKVLSTLKFGKYVKGLYVKKK